MANFWTIFWRIFWWIFYGGFLIILKSPLLKRKFLKNVFWALFEGEKQLMVIFVTNDSLGS